MFHSRDNNNVDKYLYSTKLLHVGNSAMHVCVHTFSYRLKLGWIIKFREWKNVQKCL